MESDVTATTETEMLWLYVLVLKDFVVRINLLISDSETFSEIKNTHNSHLTFRKMTIVLDCSPEWH